MERLEAFGLPPTFPTYMVPPRAARFVADTQRGMSKTELLKLAEIRGLSPLWKPLPHMGDGVYGLGLNVDGMQVPFIVRMSSNAYGRLSEVGQIATIDQDGTKTEYKMALVIEFASTAEIRQAIKEGKCTFGWGDDPVPVWN